MSNWHWYLVCAVNFYLLVGFSMIRRWTQGDIAGIKSAADLGFAFALGSLALFGSLYLGRYINQSRFVDALAKRV